MKPLSPFVLLLSFFFLYHSLKLTSADTCHVDDHQGLLGFKSGITHDPSGILASWKPTSHCCKWDGVTCSDGKRVDKLVLVGNANKPKDYLSGTISSSLSKVRFLNYIYIQETRNLSGPFPDAIFKLPRLREVYLGGNKLSGPLPQDIGNLTKLESLILGGNRFTGPIPSSISRMAQLNRISLANNLFAGKIPDEFRALTKLITFDLSGNQFSGEIPDFFSNFTDLHYLFLSHNKLTGKIPASLSAVANKMVLLEMSHNALTGPIPSFIGNFKDLVTLDLSRNHLSGPVPRSFEKLTVLSKLDLSYNNLEGSFPNMSNSRISETFLSYNQFHLGTIPDWITKAYSLNHVKLAKCGIKMNLDSWKIENPLFLYQIDLSENEIWGSPVTLFNVTTALREFRASGNMLKFNFGRLKLPKGLDILDLSRNLMFGKVPKAVGRIKELNVSYNHLCGPIPTTKFSAMSTYVGNDCLCGSPMPPCKL